MEIREISDQLLRTQTIRFSKSEREMTLNVLHHLKEIDRRNLFADFGFPSLFEYVVKELKYSEGAAQRRISSMRLLRMLPMIEKKVESGELSLCSLAKAQSFFRQEKVENVSVKLNLLKELEGKSAREVDRTLVAHSTIEASAIKDKLLAVSGTHSDLKIRVEQKVFEQLDELRNLLAHSHPHAALGEIVTYAIDFAVKAKRMKLPKQPTDAKLINAEISPPTLAVNNFTGAANRYIPIQVRRAVWARDNGECTYKAGSKRCCARHALELDHIRPFAVGGKNTIENLRLRCRAHNQHAAIVSYGREKIQQFVPRFQ